MPPSRNQIRQMPLPSSIKSTQAWEVGYHRVANLEIVRRENEFVVQPSLLSNRLPADTEDSSTHGSSTDCTHAVLVIKRLVNFSTTSGPTIKFSESIFVFGQIFNIYLTESTQSDVQRDERHVNTFNLKSLHELFGEVKSGCRS